MKYRTMFLVIVLSLLLLQSTVGASRHQSNYKHTQSSGAAEDKVVLEITRRGAGLIFPTMKQVYLRLYSSGRLELEAPPKFDTEAGRANVELVKKTSQLKSDDVAGLIKLAEKPDFQAAAKEYRPLQTWVDAVMVTTIIYSESSRVKKIVITNYSPKHEKAIGYYPQSLRMLLQKVVSLRPKTDEETEFGWNELY